MPKALPKAFVRSLDEVPEDVREYYVPTEDGRFRLNAEGVEDVTGLRSALQAERRERENREKQLAKVKDVDPEKYKELLAEHERREEEAAQRKGEYDKLLAQVNDKHKKVVDDLGAQVERLKGELARTLIEAKAHAAITEEKGVPLLLMPHIRSRTRMVERDGKFDIEVLLPDGTPMVTDKGPATIAELVKSFKEDNNFARAFDGVGAGGSGAGPNKAGQAGGAGGANGGEANPWVTGNVTQQMHLRVKDPKLAKQLILAARKPLPPDLANA